MRRCAHNLGVGVAVGLVLVAAGAPASRSRPSVAHTEQHVEPNYHYKYGVADRHTGDVKGAWEKRAGDQVWGAYFLRDPDGHWRTVHYEADKSGFHAEVKRRRLPGRQRHRGNGSGPLLSADESAGEHWEAALLAAAGGAREDKHPRSRGKLRGGDQEAQDEEKEEVARLEPQVQEASSGGAERTASLLGPGWAEVESLGKVFDGSEWPAQQTAANTTRSPGRVGSARKQGGGSNRSTAQAHLKHQRPGDDSRGATAKQEKSISERPPSGSGARDNSALTSEARPSNKRPPPRTTDTHRHKTKKLNEKKGSRWYKRKPEKPVTRSENMKIGKSSPDETQQRELEKFIGRGEDETDESRDPARGSSKEKTGPVLFEQTKAPEPEAHPHRVTASPGLGDKRRQKTLVVPPLSYSGWIPVESSYQVAAADTSSEATLHHQLASEGRGRGSAGSRAAPGGGLASPLHGDTGRS